MTNPGLVGVAGVLRRTLRNGDTIFDVRPSCTSGFAYIRIPPILTIPSIHERITVVFRISIKREIKNKKKKG